MSLRLFFPKTKVTSSRLARVERRKCHVTVETDAELASFFVVFNANGAVDLDDIHLSSLGHDVSESAAGQCATTDLKSPRSAVIAKAARGEHQAKNTPSKEISCKVTCRLSTNREQRAMF